MPLIKWHYRLGSHLLYPPWPQTSYQLGRLSSLPHSPASVSSVPLGPRVCKSHLTKKTAGTHRLQRCDGRLHTCIHVVGPSARLAAASCWRAACPRIEHVINGALHLAVIDGLGALGGAEEDGRRPVGQRSKQHQVLRPRYCTLVSTSPQKHSSSCSRTSSDLLSLRLLDH